MDDGGSVNRRTAPCLGATESAALEIGRRGGAPTERSLNRPSPGAGPGAAAPSRIQLPTPLCLTRPASPPGWGRCPRTRCPSPQRRAASTKVADRSTAIRFGSSGHSLQQRCRRAWEQQVIHPFVLKVRQSTFPAGPRCLLPPQSCGRRHHRATPLNVAIKVALSTQGGEEGTCQNQTPNDGPSVIAPSTSASASPHGEATSLAQTQTPQPPSLESARLLSGTLRKSPSGTSIARATVAALNDLDIYSVSL